MKLILSENIKETEIILVHELFKIHKTQLGVHRQLKISTKTIRGRLKKPLPQPKQTLLVDITGMSFADIRVRIMTTVATSTDTRKVMSQRLGMSSRNLRFFLDKYKIPKRVRETQKISKRKIIKQFQRGYRISDILEINSISHTRLQSILKKSLGETGYADQMIENAYQRSQLTHFKNQVKKLDKQEPMQ